MSFQDYYKILECTPQASLLEIKKSYRALARRFHPDRNSNDPKATQYFQQIQEAYEVLSNPLKRKSYDNELKVKGQYSYMAKEGIYSAEQILKQSQQLSSYIVTKGQQSINSDALVDFILALLNKESTDLLLRKNDDELNSQVIKNLISASDTVNSYQLYSQLAEKFLLIFPNPDTLMHQTIIKELNHRMEWDKQNKLVPYLSFLIIIVIICIMMLILFVL